MLAHNVVQLLAVALENNMVLCIDSLTWPIEVDSWPRADRKSNLAGSNGGELWL